MKRTNADAEYERLSKEETGSFTMIPILGLPFPSTIVPDAGSANLQ
jgi:hypothetical protein